MGETAWTKTGLREALRCANEMLALSRARVKVLETAGEDLKRDSSAAIEAISHAIHDPTTWPGIDWSGADVAAKQYEKAVAAWDAAKKGTE